MGNRPNIQYYNQYYTDYFSELQILIEAQNKAREYLSSAALRPAEEPRGLTLTGKRLFLRLKKHLMEMLINMGWRVD